MRAGRREVKKAPRLACHFKAESLRPTTPPRGPARPTQAAAPIGSQAARLRPRSPQARPHRTIPQAAGTGSASPPPPLAAARRGPMQHRRSRPTDLSRGAVGSGAHGVQIWACFARRPRMVQLVSALLRRPHALDRWSRVWAVYPSENGCFFLRNQCPPMSTDVHPCPHCFSLTCFP